MWAPFDGSEEVKSKENNVAQASRRGAIRRLDGAGVGHLPRPWLPEEPMLQHTSGGYVPHRGSGNLLSSKADYCMMFLGTT